ncbi:MAG: rod shape-determining protein MreB [Sarcina sp.]
MWFFGRGTDMGIDLGTATVLVHIKGKGVVLQEPSVVAVDKERNKVLAVGEEARQMIGRTPGNIVAIRPLRNGVISDYDVTEKMLQYFIKKGSGKHRVSSPKVIVCIPSQATEVEKRAVMDAARNSGARTVSLVEEPLAAAIGAGIDISEPNGRMVVDIGGGTCDIAVISLGGIVVRSSLKVAGDTFDEAIIKYIRNNFKLMIGERTAEELKIKVGSALKNSRDEKVAIKGRNLVTGLPDEVIISSEQVREAVEDCVRAIAENLHSVLERTPPELAADIMEAGIIMTGGGALLYGLDKYLEEATGVTVRVADDAVRCVAEGTGKILDAFSKMDIDEDEVKIVK